MTRLTLSVSIHVRRYGFARWLTSPLEVRSPGWWGRYWWFRLTGRCDCPAPRRDPGCGLGWESERAVR